MYCIILPTQCIVLYCIHSVLYYTTYTVYHIILHTQCIVLYYIHGVLYYTTYTVYNIVRLHVTVYNTGKHTLCVVLTLASAHAAYIGLLIVSSALYTLVVRTAPCTWHIVL